MKFGYGKCNDFTNYMKILLKLTLFSSPLESNDFYLHYLNHYSQTINSLFSPLIET